jgi:hypothetical protein
MYDYAKECLDIADNNFISIKNKNPIYKTIIQYSKKYKKYLILILHKTNEDAAYGEAYNNINQVYRWVDKNVDEHFTDKRGSFNIKFNYRKDWLAIHKGRLFYTLDRYEKDEDFKKLLMLLLI